MLENSQLSASVVTTSTIASVSLRPLSSPATATRITPIVAAVIASSSARLASFSRVACRIRAAFAWRNSETSDKRKTIAAASNAPMIPRPLPTIGIRAASPMAKIAPNSAKRGGAMRLPIPQ
ncbi:hypothetical protein WR25_08448 [Diploscapter pachys]|uniref:Uncharacterized protein n=1 Tax=Diploscapter pachys TaxID=2018661 RepID=A0A2A2M399_9BILA|nr:hypothetical protein WR25_08448 [Diploscapter pachys]